jgi:hypothetical protein
MMTAWEDKVRVRVGRVSLEIPQSLTKGGAGVDSEAAVFESPDLTVVVDQGPFADSLDAQGAAPGAGTETVTIAGRSARLLSTPAEGGRHTVAVHVPELDRLTVAVHAGDTVPRHVPREIIDSIRVG